VLLRAQHGGQRADLRDTLRDGPVADDDVLSWALVAAFSNGIVSIIGLTACRTLKSRVSSESRDVPEAWPRRPLAPAMNPAAGTSIGAMSAPTPSTATRPPAGAPLWRSALKVVMPAHSSGAASSKPMWSGIEASAEERTPKPGSGISRCSSSKSPPAPLTTTALMVAMTGLSLGFSEVRYRSNIATAQ
jgi:hypothetical protein